MTTVEQPAPPIKYRKLRIAWSVAWGVLFGLVSGLLWSFAPGVLAGLFNGSTPGAILASIASGSITSAILAPLLTRVRRRGTIVLGLLSLPVGAFIFGSVFGLIVQFLPSLTEGAFGPFAPWHYGFNYVLLSVATPFAVMLFPLALVTTFLLKMVLLRAAEQYPSAH